MIIMKFGGSSLANAERMRHVAAIVEGNVSENPLLVLSAMGKTTDDLVHAGQVALLGRVEIEKIETRHFETLVELQLSKEVIEDLFAELMNLLKGISLIKELTPRTRDYLVSFGERLATRIFAAYLNSRGMKSQFLDGWDMGIVTSSDFTRASVLPESYENIRDRYHRLEKGTIPVITGFIAKDIHDVITTLGRGGSDLTAAILGAALEVKEIQVWKDVHGILTTDPRLVKEAQPIPLISFEQAAELAYFGAKVLHPLSILPAMKKAIPVRVKNSYDPSHPGTIILPALPEEKDLVTAITLKTNQVLVHICSTRMLGQYGFLAKVFQIFERLKISVDVIATSEVSISLTLDNQESLRELERQLQEIATVSLHPGQTMISLIGNRTSAPKILERALNTLSQEGIKTHMISQGASNVNTSIIIGDQDATEAIRQLHEAFFKQKELIA